MTNFLSSRMLFSDGLVYSFNPTTATIDGFSFTIPDSFDVYSYDVLKVDENTNLLVGSASSIDGDGSGIFYTSFGNDGFISDSIEILNEYRYGDQKSPTVAKSDTEILVTWNDTHSNSLPGTTHFFDLSLNDIGQQTSLGRFYYSAVSTEGDETDFSLFDQRSSRSYHKGISSDGTILDEEQISIGSEFGVITATNGKTWLADSAGGDVYLGQFVNGSRTDRVNVNFSLDGNQSRPSIIELSDENLFVTWSTDYNLHGRFFSSEGQPLSLDILLASDVIGPAGADEYAATYSISARETGGFSIYYADTTSSLKVKSFDSSGAVVQDATVLAENVLSYSIKVLTLSDTQDEVFYTINSQLYSQKLNVNSVPAGDLVIFGEAAEDSTLTLSHSLSDNDGLGDFSYQWLRDDEAITNATGITYQLDSVDIGSQLKIQVQYTDGIGVTETITSDPTTAIQNVNDAPAGYLSISGELADGKELTAVSNITDEDGIGEFSYIWYRDDIEIVGETKSSLTLSQTEVGKNISVEAIYTDNFGNIETVISDVTSAVINLNDDPIGSVIINGTAKEDQVLSIDVSGLSDPDGLGAFSYQWIRDGSAVEGARSETYTLEQADVGSELSARVSYSDGFGFAESVISSGTSTITNLNDDVSGTISVVGTLEENRTLSVDTNSLTDEDGLGEFFYQWKSDDESIFGATSGSFKLTQSEVGKSISVSVSFTDDYGGVEQVTSTATSAVQNLNNAPAGVVSLDGIASMGATLTANTTLLSDLDGLGALSYQWLRSGLTVDGATDPSFTLSDLDIGEIFSVRVNYTDGFGETETVMSSQSSFVDGGFLDLNVATFDRFGGELSSIVSADSLMNGDQFFVQEVVGDASSDNEGFSVSTYAIIVRPEVDIAAVDFNLIATSGLVDFTPSSSLLNWTFQTNTSDLDKVVFSGIATTDGENDLPRGQDTAIAFFDVISVADFTVNETSLNGVTKQDVFTIGELTAVSQNGSDTLYEVLHGADTFVFADKTIDTASDRAIGAYDALQALRLAVGLDKSDGTSEWHDYLAADINKDGRVGADDALDILKFAVGLTDGAPADWIFVDGDADYSAIDRKNTDYDEGILISDVMTDLSINMTGILVGDVDGSYLG